MRRTFGPVVEAVAQELGAVGEAAAALDRHHLHEVGPGRKPRSALPPRDPRRHWWSELDRLAQADVLCNQGAAVVDGTARRNRQLHRADVADRKQEVNVTRVNRRGAENRQFIARRRSDASQRDRNYQPGERHSRHAGMLTRAIRAAGRFATPGTTSGPEPDDLSEPQRPDKRIDKRPRSDRDRLFEDAILARGAAR